MSDNISPEQNEETLDRLWARLKRKGDGKCYCPCNNCKGLKTRRLLITTAEKHCRQHGHVEGGHDYRPLVSCSLYVFILIEFVNVYIVLTFYIYIYI